MRSNFGRIISGPEMKPDANALNVKITWNFKIIPLNISENPGGVLFANGNIQKKI